MCMTFATARIARNTRSNGKYLLFIQADNKEFTITTYIGINELVEDVLSQFNLKRTHSSSEMQGHVEVFRVMRCDTQKTG